MAANADILPDLLKLNNLLIAEKDFTVVIENIMDTAANICNADCGFFYTLNDDNFLSLDYSFNKSQRTALRGSDNLTLFQTVYLPERKTKNPKSVVEICYFNNEVVNTANLYGSPDLDNSFFGRLRRNQCLPHDFGSYAPDCQPQGKHRRHCSVRQPAGLQRQNRRLHFRNAENRSVCFILGRLGSRKPPHERSLRSAFGIFH